MKYIFSKKHSFLKKYSTKIYLLMIDTPDTRLYKIGSTKKKISERIRSLQTGCPYEIKLLESFETEYGQMVERTLHNRYNEFKTYGEWFHLGLEEELQFINICNSLENINETLEKNNTI